MVNVILIVVLLLILALIGVVFAIGFVIVALVVKGSNSKEIETNGVCIGYKEIIPCNYVIFETMVNGQVIHTTLARSFSNKEEMTNMFVVGNSYKIYVNSNNYSECRGR